MLDRAEIEKIKLVLLVILVIVFSITAGLSLSRLTSPKALKKSSSASEIKPSPSLPVKVDIQL